MDHSIRHINDIIEKDGTLLSFDKLCDIYTDVKLRYQIDSLLQEGDSVKDNVNIFVCMIIQKSIIMNSLILIKRKKQTERVIFRNFIKHAKHDVSDLLNDFCLINYSVCFEINEQRNGYNCFILMRTPKM